MEWSRDNLCKQNTFFYEQFSNFYIVPTPIGNLSDITERALETLNKVDLIAAEDTRHSGILLKHYGIKTKCVALHEHNEKQKSAWLLEQLRSGRSIALISDAGTPLISDPGYATIAMCHQEGIQIIPLPGACAATTALCASGLPTDRFIFEGFLPSRSSARQTRLEAFADETRTLIFYESPRRILGTLQDIAAVLGDRRVTLARELTKTYETITLQPVTDLIVQLQNDSQQQRGEMVLILEGCPVPEKDTITAAAKQTLASLLSICRLKKQQQSQRKSMV